MTSNGWDEWRNHVLAEIRRLSESLAAHNALDQKYHDEMIKEIETLKVKSSLWGLAGGLIPALAAFIYYMLKH